MFEISRGIFVKSTSQEPTNPTVIKGLLIFESDLFINVDKQREATENEIEEAFASLETQKINKAEESNILTRVITGVKSKRVSKKIVQGPTLEESESELEEEEEEEESDEEEGVDKESEEE